MDLGKGKQLFTFGGSVNWSDVEISVKVPQEAKI